MPTDGKIQALLCLVALAAKDWHAVIDKAALDFTYA